MHLSTRGHVNSLAEAISIHARQLMSQGRKDLIFMNVGQPSTGAPKAALAALEKHAEQDILGYTPASGYLFLKERIAKHYHDEYQLTISPHRIFITFGASGAFILAFLSLLDAGQKVALPLPCYPAYLHTARSLGLKPVLLHTQLKHNYQPTIADLEALPEKIDALVITSPGNPTGSMVTPEELKALVTYCQQKNILLISDEIYHGVVLTDRCKAACALQYADDVLVMNSFSKYYSMPGWRCGWMVLPESLVGPIGHMARTMYVSPNAPSQIVAHAAFDCKAELDEHVKRYAINRQILMRELPKAGFIDAPAPDGAFYYYARVDGLKTDSLAFCKEMLDKVGIAASVGMDYDPVHGKEYVRFSYAGSTESMFDAMERLKKWRG